MPDVDELLELQGGFPVATSLAATLQQEMRPAIVAAGLAALAADVLGQIVPAAGAKVPSLNTNRLPAAHANARHHQVGKPRGDGANGRA